MKPKAERLGLVGNVIVTFDQDDVAGPGLLKPNTIDNKRRVLDGHLDPAG